MIWTAHGISHTTETSVPCWDMNNGYFETSSRMSVASSYTLFYYWKPSSATFTDGCLELSIPKTKKGYAETARTLAITDKKK